jgi:tripartite ATP-independent transporter DctM subunit
MNVALLPGDAVPIAPHNALSRLAAKTERLLAVAVELPAAILVAVEIAVLFAGVVSRYVFHRPLTWSDELASILFMWLAMLGAVVAFDKSAHMRMTALVARCSPARRPWAETAALIVPIVFLAFVFPPAFEYARGEMDITTPALEIANAWRAAALPIGIGLMAIFALLQLAQRASWRQVLVVAVAVATIVAALIAITTWTPAVFASLGRWNLVVFFVFGVGAMVLSGIPIAFCFGLATLGFIVLTTGVPSSVVVGRMDEGMSHLILLAVPLFIFLGGLIEVTGMAKKMVDFLASLIGHVKGGLSYVLLGAMVLVSGISGAKAADMAAVAPVLFPEMKERGAKPGELVALLSASGAMSETIPPSLVLITIGSVTGVSIAALFAGGLVPALVLAIALAAVARWRAKDEVSTAVRATWPTIARFFAIALPGLALPFIIRAAVIEGVATATEVSTIGVVYALVVGALVYRRCPPRALARLLVDTASLSGAILLIIGTATAMAWALTQSGFSNALALAMGSLPGGKASFIAISIVAFVILGSVLEGIPAIVLFGPLLFPIARIVGVHEVHYAMVVVLAMGIGLFAPPFGVGYYAACAIGRVDPAEGMKPIVGYLVALLVGLVVVACVPWLSIGFL